VNKEIKIIILKALKSRLISKDEAMQLIKSKGIIKLDLSIYGNQDPVFSIIQKLPLKGQHFIKIINLGDGKRP